MCFSATASFGAATILSAIGIASIRKAESPKQFVFASIPFLFSIQQFAEGVLWLALTDPDYAGFEKPSTYIFLVFAQIVWPLHIPLAVYLLEKERRRKSILLALSTLGLAVALFRIYWLSTYESYASISNHHISYEIEYSNSITYYGAILYFMATVTPPFLSSIKKMTVLGAILLLSFIIAQIFYQEVLTSVWCFFAAIISGSIYLITKEINISSPAKEATVRNSI